MDFKTQQVLATQHSNGAQGKITKSIAFWGEEENVSIECIYNILPSLTQKKNILPSVFKILTHKLRNI